MDSLLAQRNKTLLVAGAVTAAALGGFYYYFTSCQACDEQLLPALELEETQKIMAKILEKLKFIALKHSRAGQHIKMQLEQQGQQMADEDVMRHFILPHFENAFEEAQEEVLDEFDCEESELQEAAQYYAKQGDSKLQEIINKIQQMHKQFGGENEGVGGTGGSSAGGSGSQRGGGGSKDMSLGEVIAVLQALSERVGNGTDEYVEEFKRVNGLPESKDAMMRFQQGMLEMSEAMESAVLEAYGVTQQDFQQALMANQNDPVLQQTVMAMQMANQQRLAAHGIQLQM